MNIAKRVFLLISINLLVMVTISILLNLLGIQPYLTAKGINYEALATYCLIWGFGGAFISLCLSRFMAKMMLGVRVIDPNTHDPELQDLVHRVHALARSAGISVMPEVGIYDSPELNAFATGPTKNRSLVAVSTGLIRRMSAEEVDGVLGHEIAHIANGDMVTMTLVQGMVNAFVMFLSRVIAFAISQALRSGDREESRGSSMGGMGFFMLQMTIEMVLMFFGAMIVAYVSRMREFRADKGGARLAGQDKMVKALQALQRNYELIDPAAQPAVQTLKISGRSGGWIRLFSSHPPLAERIERLQKVGI